LIGRIHKDSISKLSFKVIHQSCKLSIAYIVIMTFFIIELVLVVIPRLNSNVSLPTFRASKVPAHRTKDERSKYQGFGF
jgi:hypothetical protein